MISVTFPDGAARRFPAGIRGSDIAKGISPSLAKRTIAMALNGKVTDLADPIEHDAKIEFIDRDDPRALERDPPRCRACAGRGGAVALSRHAGDDRSGHRERLLLRFFPQRAVHAEDFPAIEKKMAEIIARDKPFTKEVWTRDQAKAWFEEHGEAFKVELVDAIPADQDLKIYKQGEWLDLCRGPHMTSTGKIGSAFKLMKVAGAYWRGDSNKPMLSRIYATAFANRLNSMLT